MGKSVADTVLDQALNKIGTATRQVVCSGQPANFAGIAALNLAQKTLVGGDWTVAAGAQRKTNVVAATAIAITATGTANHISYDDGTTLLSVTTCTAQALTSGGTVTIPTHKFEFGSPT